MKKQKRFKRGAGILMPITSLPSEYGIGTLGKEAYRFADFLAESGQKYWQVLPVGPTSYGDSPYQSFSAFAGNPYFIDLETLIDEGLLTKKDVEKEDWGSDIEKVDYAKIFESRFNVLRVAYSKQDKNDAGFALFKKENKEALGDYCFYMALKFEFDNKSWLEWDEPVRMREKSAMEKYKKLLADEIDFWWFLQYKFYEQWNKLRSYVNNIGVQIIGDIPIYVAMDSADTWANPEQFQLDKRKRPTAVAGVPPDYFSATGQLWGNPLYDWDYMKEDNFSWWKKRMSFSAKLYDIIRIDHFIGIVRYYSIPADSETAMIGEYKEGPGIDLIEAINEAIGDSRIIAEDLGVSLKPVQTLLKKIGYPGMKVLVFGFDSDAKNVFLPHHFEANYVAYGGTHDNDTLVGYFAKQKPKQLRFIKDYLNVKRTCDMPKAAIKLGYSSVADTVIFQMQDYLELDNKARINYPSTVGGNWEWRAKPDYLSAELAERIKRLTVIYDR